jgi:hypothetical protein
MSEDLEPISHKEFDTRLIRLPFQIFLLIAESDDEVHTDEWMTLIKMLKEKTVCESPTHVVYWEKQKINSRH